nr:carbohydrate ABC transporter permease [uncultured Tyzzerella sp.]
MKNKKKTNFLLYLFFGFALLMAVIDLFPFIWSLYTSFRPMSEVYEFNINLKNLTLESYIQIFSSFPVFKWYFNSIFVAIIVTIGSILMNSAAGYALARLDFSGKKFIFICILAVMMIPGQVIMIPTYMMISKLGWVNTYTGLTVPFFFSAFNVFMMRQFYISFPKELEEAALIDGLNKITIYFKVVLRLSTAPLTTLVILGFIGNWNSFLYPSLLTSTPDMYTLPVGLSLLQGQYYAFPNQVMAGTMISTLPMVALYIILQRKFVAGIANTGIKG